MPPQNSGPHVLLIDGVPSILDTLGMLLEDEGYRVSVTLAPPEPAFLLELAPDLIVQELRFGRSLNVGWTSLTCMQLLPETARIPVILCTTESDRVNEPGMAENLDKLGVRVLLKPFILEDFLSAVADALTARRLLDQMRQRYDGGSVSVNSPPPGVGSTCSI